MKFAIIFFISLLSLGAAAQQVQIIPQPVKLQVGKGNFNLSSKTTIVYTDEGEKASADFFNLYLKEYYGFTLPVAK